MQCPHCNSLQSSPLDKPPLRRPISPPFAALSVGPLTSKAVLRLALKTPAILARADCLSSTHSKTRQSKVYKNGSPLAWSCPLSSKSIGTRMISSTTTPFKIQTRLTLAQCLLAGMPTFKTRVLTKTWSATLTTLRSSISTPMDSKSRRKKLARMTRHSTSTQSQSALKS